MTRKLPSPDDSPDLLARFRKGDSAAFDEIVGRHRRPLYLVARRLLRSHEEADEATQLAFLRAWRARARFRGDSALGTWLTRIVINVARSRLASRQPSGEPEELERIRDPGEPAEERILRQRLRARVRRAVAALPERQREVVLLKVFSDMTYREVAEVLKLSEGAVKAHLHQAVSNLRKRMLPAEVGQGS